MKISHRQAAIASRWYDAFFCRAGQLRRQVRRGALVTPEKDAFSVAVAHYNRGSSAYQPLCHLLSSPWVKEVVFFDDGSPESGFRALQETVHSLDRPDVIRIERRHANKGAQQTKIDAVAACRSEWVLVLDSDNTAFPLYLSELGKIRCKNPDTIYCSPFAFPYFSFRGLAGQTLNFEDCCRLTKTGLLRRCFIINDGNYLVHRETYLRRIAPLGDLESDVADVMVANYKWLSDGGLLSVLARGAYHHRIDASSFWMQTADESRARVMTIFSLFEQGITWQAGGAAMINAPARPIS